MTYSHPAAYEQFMGRWSARLAPLFIRFVGVGDGQRVLDVGCGTGSLSRSLLASSKAMRVVGVDPTEDYVTFARQRVLDSRATFQVGSAESLPFPDKSFDAAMALLVVQDMDDPGRAVREMARHPPGWACRGLPVGLSRWHADVFAVLAGGRGRGAGGHGPLQSPAV